MTLVGPKQLHRFERTRKIKTVQCLPGFHDTLIFGPTSSNERFVHTIVLRLFGILRYIQESRNEIPTLGIRPNLTL